MKYLLDDMFPPDLILEEKMFELPDFPIVRNIVTLGKYFLDP